MGGFADSRASHETNWPGRRDFTSTGIAADSSSPGLPFGRFLESTWACRHVTSRSSTGPAANPRWRTIWLPISSSTCRTAGDSRSLPLRPGGESAWTWSSSPPRRAVRRIAERFFSAAEVATLRALPRELREEAFFACWTRKEAYIKARGAGLSIPLGSFSVTLAPGEPAALLDYPSSPEEIRAWSLRSLETVPGFAAALAVEGEGWRLEERSWGSEGLGIHRTLPFMNKSEPRLATPERRIGLVVNTRRLNSFLLARAHSNVPRNCSKVGLLDT